MNFEIIKEKTCAVTGHRDIDKNFDREILRIIFLKLIEEGYDCFLIGMALGFDTMCFQILEKIREKKDIKIIAVIPCLTQDYKFSVEDKKEYQRMIKSSNQKIILSKDYTPYCMTKRNMFMVDNCSLLISYLRRESGGTFKTVKYAESKNVEIIKI